MLPDVVPLICDVPALNVKLVNDKLTNVELVKFNVLELSVIVRMFELLEESCAALMVYPAVFNVPFVTVTLFDPTFNASASCTVPP